MTSMKTQLATLLLIAVPAFSAEIDAELDAIAAAAYAADEPGAAIIVIKDGQTLLEKGYGMAELELGIAIEPDMVFRIGSVTKSFTATAIFILVAESEDDLPATVASRCRVVRFGRAGEAEIRQALVDRD